MKVILLMAPCYTCNWNLPAFMLDVVYTYTEVLQEIYNVEKVCCNIWIELYKAFADRNVISTNIKKLMKHSSMQIIVLLTAHKTITQGQFGLFQSTVCLTWYLWSYMWFVSTGVASGLQTVRIWLDFVALKCELEERWGEVRRGEERRYTVILLEWHFPIIPLPNTAYVRRQSVKEAVGGGGEMGSIYCHTLFEYEAAKKYYILTFFSSLI